MKIGLLGRKIGMTRVYDASGKATPVTVIDAGGNTILQIKTQEQDGYNAVQVGFDAQKESRVPKPLLGHFKKANAEPKKFVREFRLPDGTPLDGDLNLSVNQFEAGEFVDVIGRSKGKGFQGVVRKHGFAGQPAAHGSKMHRRNGAIGNRSTPGRVWKNMGMPGHMGDDRVTIQNLRIVQVRPEENIILVCGAVPGSNGSYVVVRPAKKKSAAGGGKTE
ncbi:MAG: 50S ribosomal protein L3 [Verrucomicrobia bacterium]|jgi:large subunit ribosomal protein L3|nr:50S ribosomal protein L3 [Verrucomicrobiota bacterium]MBV8532530.1 50S ribosomal protein L3 [Verrucomicrobiota bacterium]